MMDAIEHRRLLQSTKDLDTLLGNKHKHRRVLKQLFDAQDGKCMWCGESTFLWWTISNSTFVTMDRNRMASFEHIVPKSQGGINTADNGGCACHECNTLRGTISYNSFKYLTANPTRFQKWKDKRYNRPQNIKKRKLAQRRLEQKRDAELAIFSLASMFHTCKQQYGVDLFQQFYYNQAIVKTLGEEYGLL